MIPAFLSTSALTPSSRHVAYGRRKGIAYATWRELGVSAEVLKKAGITRAG